jgi:hypothetical protein
VERVTKDYEQSLLDTIKQEATRRSLNSYISRRRGEVQTTAQETALRNIL